MHKHGCYLVDLQPLIAAHRQHALRNLVGQGLAELKLKAVVAQRLELLAVAVVANADNWDLGLLDCLDQVGHASAVTACTVQRDEEALQDTRVEVHGTQR